MTQTQFRDTLKIFLCVWMLGLTACGYTFQNAKNPLLEKEGIHKVYIEPITNESYKAGIENTVYNSLVRAIFSHHKVTLVSNRADADAILSGSVLTANYGMNIQAAVAGLNPKDLAERLKLPSREFAVAQDYMATLGCSFSLVRAVPHRKKRTGLWASSFSRTKPFPGANQIDVPGTTSALINESEFERTLSELAKSMMDDVHESMLAMF
jgi:hypothetical protein